MKWNQTKTKMSKPADVEQLYMEYRDYIHRLCVVMIKNFADAEDITQEVFMQMQKDIGDFRGDGHFRAWLRRVAVNKCLLFFQSRNYQKQKLTDAIVDDLIPARSSRILDRIAINEALDQMPEASRDVFLLHDLVGYEYREIARIQGKSELTLSPQCFKARKKMRSLLSQRNYASA